VTRYACLLLAVIALAAASATAVGEQATLIQGKAVLNLGQFDLAQMGYVTEEFFLSGNATSYEAGGDLGEGGRWQAIANGSAPFTTRLICVMPSSPSKFNGSVVVEWLNVTTGGDWAPDWLATHRELLRKGFAWVGVSAQRAGIDAGVTPARGMSFGGKPLKVQDPVRYAKLSHPGDAFAYDMFSQAGRAIRGGGDSSLLRPLKPKRLLAVGESQSASFLTTYVNAIDPIAKIYDGFLIHSRNRTSAEIDGTYVGATERKVPKVVNFRADLRTPILTVITELDLTNYFPARQPDTDRLRTWEIPGASHVDEYLANTANVDSGEESIEALAAAFAPSQEFMGGHVAKPMNAAPQHHYVMNAAIAALDRWVKDGKSPAHGPRIAVIPNQDPISSITLQRDANGNSEGGIRTPWMDVPTATLSGLGNSGALAAVLVGTTVPFDRAKLDALYPAGKVEYLKKFAAALRESIDAGFILHDDEREILALASVTYPVNVGGH
jgi:hypothetical protein